MTTFTPGPWLIYQHPFAPEPSWFDIFTLQDGEEVDIAENVTADNARLIAAAPALYEALKEAHGVLRDYITAAGPIDGVDRRLLLQITAALAAATGDA